MTTPHGGAVVFGHPMSVGAVRRRTTITATDRERSDASSAKWQLIVGDRDAPIVGGMGAHSGRNGARQSLVGDESNAGSAGATACLRPAESCFTSVAQPPRVP
jgi:hypothetical protein